jgi:hypothetical protein
MVESTILDISFYPFGFSVSPPADGLLRFAGKNKAILSDLAIDGEIT